MGYYRARDLAGRDRYRCVAVVYDEFVRLCDTAEQVAVTSYLYDGANKSACRSNREGDNFGYYSSAPISECSRYLRLSRRQRGYSLQKLRERGLVRNQGYWAPQKDGYFIPGTAKYHVWQAFQLQGRNALASMKLPQLKGREKDALKTYTPVYGWMIAVTGSFDELMVLAFIVRRYRFVQERAVILSNEYIRKHTGLSYYAIRKALKALVAKGLILVKQEQQGMPRKVYVLKELRRLIREHEKASRESEKKREELGIVVSRDINDRRRGRIYREYLKHTRSKKCRRDEYDDDYGYDDCYDDCEHTGNGAAPDGGGGQWVLVRPCDMEGVEVPTMMYIPPDGMELDDPFEGLLNF